MHKVYQVYILRVMNMQLPSFVSRGVSEVRRGVQGNGVVVECTDDR